MFSQTSDSLRGLYKLLSCVNCSRLPNHQIWMLSDSCTHKYCEQCILKLNNRQGCIKCDLEVSSETNTLKPRVDPVTTSLLGELRKFESYLHSKGQTSINGINGTSMSNCEGSIYSLESNQEKQLIKPVATSTSTASVYDLGQHDVLEMEKMDNEEMGKLPWKKKGRTTRTVPNETLLEQLKLDDRPDTPPLLTQHGNTPKRGFDPPVRLDLVSPALPILSPNIEPDKRPKRESGKKLDFKKKPEAQPDPDVSKVPRHKRRKENAEAVAVLKEDIYNSKTTVLPSAMKSRNEGKGGNLSATFTIQNGGSGIKRSGRQRQTIRNGNRRSSNSSRVSSNSKNTESTVTSSSASTWVTTSSISGSPLSSITKRNSKGESTLHIACRKGEVEKVKQLLEMGTDINAKDFAGWTPLHEAINSKSNNNFAIIEALCTAGCKVNSPGLDNETPLHEAVRVGKFRIIKYLLSHRASTKLRNRVGHLPRDITTNDTTIKILDEYNGPYSREPSNEDFADQLRNSVTFLVGKMDEGALQWYKNELKATVATQFSQDVTHVVFSSKLIEEGKVQLSLNYLLSVLNGCWILSSKWIEDSAKQTKCMDLKQYEIVGCLREVKSLGESRNVPFLARDNKESGNPKLLHGFNFYFYKTCSYGTFTKKDLTKLIVLGDATAVNREPNPDAIDPMDNPTRFHAKDPGHKLVLTSHIILYSEESVPEKKYSMEHVKTLRIEWLIDSILAFNLLDPEDYL